MRRWPYMTEPDSWGPSSLADQAPSPITVHLQGLVFETRKRGASRISLAELDGWTNGSTARGGPVPNEYGPGGTWGMVFPEGRRLRLGGMIHGATQRDLWRQMEDLGSVLTAPVRDWLRVDEEHLGMSRQIEVTRLERPLITPLSQKHASYTLTVESATFPRLGTEENVTSIPVGGSAAAVNVGNHDTVLEAMFYGPLLSPRLRFGGAEPGTWRYGANIGVGQRLQVEFDRRIVRNPGTQGHSRVYASGDWPALVPGQTTFWLEGSGSGRVELRWRSAWS